MSACRSRSVRRDSTIILSVVAPPGRLPASDCEPNSQGQRGESLREVPDQPLCFGIVLLRQQAHIVGKADHPFEDRSGVVSTTEEHQIIDQPERAGEKFPLAWRQAVDVRMRRVANHEPVTTRSRSMSILYWLPGEPPWSPRPFSIS